MGEPRPFQIDDRVHNGLAHGLVLAIDEPTDPEFPGRPGLGPLWLLIEWDHTNELGIPETNLVRCRSWCLSSQIAPEGQALRDDPGPNERRPNCRCTRLPLPPARHIAHGVPWIQRLRHPDGGHAPHTPNPWRLQLPTPDASGCDRWDFRTFPDALNACSRWYRGEYPEPGAARAVPGPPGSESTTSPPGGP